MGVACVGWSEERTPTGNIEGKSLTLAFTPTAKRCTNMSLNPTDPKWLEILKANGWQTTALTAACIAIIFLVKQNIIPTTDNPLWIAIPSIFGVIFGFLSLAAIGNAFVTTFELGTRIRRWLFMRNKAKEVNDFIPYMTDKDREIIGYLLYHNQKTFQASSDGGYAASLIAKGIVRVACKQGQIIDHSLVPFEVPDFAWEVLEQNRDSFPYKPPQKSKTEDHPWIIPWQAR